jgi:hypothetical protein
VTAVAAITSSSGRIKFATAGEDKSIFIWKAKSKDARSATATSFRVTSLTSDHTSLIYDLAYHTSRKWLMSTSKRVSEGPFSLPCANHLQLTFESQLHVHDITTGQIVNKYATFDLVAPINTIQEM